MLRGGTLLEPQDAPVDAELGARTLSACDGEPPTLRLADDWLEAPLMVMPDVLLTGRALVLAVDTTDGTLDLRLDVAGEPVTVSIPDPAWTPDVRPGEAVIARTTHHLGRPVSLALRDEAGALIGLWVRGTWNGAEPDLAGLLHAGLAPGPSCESADGGRCGRSMVEWALHSSRADLVRGEASVVATPEGPIEVLVHALFIEGELPAGTFGCSAAPLGAVSLDARPAE